MLLCSIHSHSSQRLHQQETVVFYQQVGFHMFQTLMRFGFDFSWPGREEEKGEENLVKMEKEKKNNPTMMPWCHFKTVVLMNNLKPTQEPIPGLAKLGAHPTAN